jgi:DNA-binding NtrC family response regulator
VKDQLELLVAEMYRSGVLYEEGVKEFKRRFVLHVLRAKRQNQCKAAVDLRMHRNTIRRTMAELGIVKDRGLFVSASEFPEKKDSGSVSGFISRKASSQY